MRMQRNFYEVLGVQRNATQQQLKERYLDLARQFHPDRAKDKEIADRLFVQINRAYTTLSNPGKRAQYDATLIASVQVPGRQQSPPFQQSAPVPTSAAEPISVQQIRQWSDQASRLQLQNQFDRAIELCSKVLAADPNNFPSLLLMGDLLVQTGKEQEAVGMYERAARIQPANRLLREKMQRVQILLDRRAKPSRPGITTPAASNIRPQPHEPAPPVKEEAAAPKSFLDRLINRK